MTAEDWIDAFSEAIGAAAPDADTRDTLLALAGVAAHNSERIAAPIACYLAGQAGIDPDVALELARDVPVEAGDPGEVDEPDEPEEADD